jgi:hypothetical protein
MNVLSQVINTRALYPINLPTPPEISIVKTSIRAIKDASSLFRLLLFPSFVLSPIKQREKAHKKLPKETKNENEEEKIKSLNDRWVSY